MRTPAQPIAPDLDEFPIAAYEDFDLDAYDLWIVFKDVTTRRDSKESISIMTSRGCTARCTFCSTFVIWRPGPNSPKGWRARGPNHVVDEIEYLYKEHGKRFFNIVDDLFTADENRVVEICKELIRRKLDILWDCETRVTMVTPEMLGWMRRAGCHSVAYGVESLGEWVLKRMKKDITVEDVYRAFAWTRAAGINARAMLMIGNPGEDEASIRASCEFIEASRPHTVQTSVTMIFPGTALYHWARRHGFIDDSYWLTDKPAPYNTVEHPYRILRRWEGMVLAAQATGIERKLREMRSWVESRTGIHVTMSEVDVFRGNDLVRTMHYPVIFGRQNPMWFSREVTR